MKERMKMKLKDKKLFLLDMDGTIYLDNDLFDGTIDFLDEVKAKGGIKVHRRIRKKA